MFLFKFFFAFSSYQNSDNTIRL